MTGRRHYTPRLTDAAGRRRGTAGSDYVLIAIGRLHPTGLPEFRRSGRHEALL
jgi:hypothetical protein